MKPEAPTKASPIVQALDTAFRYLRWLAILIAVLYLATGITSVQPGEQAIVLTLGKVRTVKTSGLLLAWPYPVDEVVRVQTGEAKRLEVKDLWKALPPTRRGGEAADPLSPEIVFLEEYVPDKIDPLREGYCITGDKDILQAYVAVRYRISDPVAYALGQTRPEDLLKDVVMTALTHTLGEKDVDAVLRQRSLIGNLIKRRVEQRLDAVKSGIKVDTVELVYVHPPRHVIKDFHQVTLAEVERAKRVEEARSEEERRKSQAQAEALSIVTAAENDARLMRENALGEAQAFRELVAEYRKSPQVVAARLYREAVEEIAAHARVHAVTATPGGRTTFVIDENAPKEPQR